MTIKLTLYSVLQYARGLGQHANDLEPALARMELLPIGREADRLPDRKFMCCHSRSPLGMQTPQGEFAKAAGRLHALTGRDLVC